MKRTSEAIAALIAAAITLGALDLASCAAEPPLLEIGASADGSRVTLAPGQELRVTVAANPATGYRWVIDRGAAAVLQPVDEPLYTPTSTSVPLVGAGGTMTFDFRAAAAGSDTLELTYRRPSPTGSVVARSLRVEILVH